MEAGMDEVETKLLNENENAILTALERLSQDGLKAVRDLARERGRNDIADELDMKLTADRQAQDRAWAKRLGIVRQ